MMSQKSILKRYNYDRFTRETFEPWMNFDASPLLGQVAPDFPLWHLDGTETRLSKICEQHRYTIVEFGSFT
jgi:hypothetical protein